VSIRRLITRSRPGSRANRGGGVAGLEALLALRALASDLLDITVLAPELKFINLLMSIDQPIKPPRVRGLGLEEAVADLAPAGTKRRSTTSSSSASA
jgi:hypothetical protein